MIEKTVIRKRQVRERIPDCQRVRRAKPAEPPAKPGKAAETENQSPDSKAHG